MQKLFHNNTKYKYFFNEDKEMLEKCNKICEKGNIILEKKRFYSSLLQAEKGGNK